MKYPLYQAAIMGTVVLLLGGCAATAETADSDQLKASVATAQSSADSARTIAVEARDTANLALSEAREAKAIAETALSEARAASEKADRMYQKAVSK